MFNPFSTLNLPVSFEVDLEQLDNNYHELMRVYHPDRLVNEDVKSKRELMQKSTEINDAYNILKSEIERAQTIINLAEANNEYNSENVVRTDNEFIMQQFTLRSKVDSLRQNFDVDSYLNLDNICKQLRKDTVATITKAFEDKDYEFAQRLVYRLQFIRKLASELSDLEM